MGVGSLIRAIILKRIKGEAALERLYELLDAYGWLPLAGIHADYDQEELWALRDRPELRELLARAVREEDYWDLMGRIMGLPGALEGMPSGLGDGEWVPC